MEAEQKGWLFQPNLTPEPSDYQRLEKALPQGHPLDKVLYLVDHRLDKELIWGHLRRDLSSNQRELDTAPSLVERTVDIPVNGKNQIMDESPTINCTLVPNTIIL